MPRKSDKRDRLLGSARRLFHHQGFRKTTLADIAEDAGVPLGNVYYYFKTKDEICTAVIEAHGNVLGDRLWSMEEDDDPKARLGAYLASAAPDAEEIARYGCAIGSLAQELDKEGGELAEKAGGLVQMQIDWTQEQFRRIGRGDAEALAIGFVASIQGILLVANALNSAETCSSQIDRLKKWIEVL